VGATKDENDEQCFVFFTPLPPSIPILQSLRLRNRRVLDFKNLTESKDVTKENDEQCFVFRHSSHLQIVQTLRPSIPQVYSLPRFTRVCDDGRIEPKTLFVVSSLFLAFYRSCES
jgi:hypothetical protein